jgi:hypothetical protein
MRETFEDVKYYTYLRKNNSKKNKEEQYCPRSGYTLTADSTRYLSTDDESKRIFSLNCISASNSVTDYSP